MAEGHAVIRWARRLAPLVGEPLVEVRMPNSLFNHEFGNDSDQTAARGFVRIGGEFHQPAASSAKSKRQTMVREKFSSPGSGCFDGRGNIHAGRAIDTDD